MDTVYVPGSATTITMLIVVAILAVCAVFEYNVTKTDRCQQSGRVRYFLVMTRSMLGAVITQLHMQTPPVSNRDEKNKRPSSDASPSQSTSLSSSVPPTQNASSEKSTGSSSHRRQGSRLKLQAQHINFDPPSSTVDDSDPLTSAPLSSSGSTGDNSPGSAKSDESQSIFFINFTAEPTTTTTTTVVTTAATTTTTVTTAASDPPASAVPQTSCREFIDGQSISGLSKKADLLAFTPGSGGGSDASALVLRDADHEPPPCPDRTKTTVAINVAVSSAVPATPHDSDGDGDGESMASDDHSEQNASATGARTETIEQVADNQCPAQEPPVVKSGRTRRRRRARSKKGNDTNREQQGNQAEPLAQRPEQPMQAERPVVPPLMTERPRLPAEQKIGNFQTWPKTRQQYGPHSQHTHPTFYKTATLGYRMFVPTMVGRPAVHEAIKRPPVFARNDPIWKPAGGTPSSTSSSSSSNGSSNASTAISSNILPPGTPRLSSSAAPGTPRVTTYADVTAAFYDRDRDRAHNSPPLHHSLSSPALSVSTNFTPISSRKSSIVSDGGPHWTSPFSSDFSIPISPPESPVDAHAPSLPISSDDSSAFSFFSGEKAKAVELPSVGRHSLPPSHSDGSGNPCMSPRGIPSYSAQVSTYANAHRQQQQIASYSGAMAQRVPYATAVSASSSAAAHLNAFFPRRTPVQDQEKGELPDEIGTWKTHKAPKMPQAHHTEGRKWDEEAGGESVVDGDATSLTENALRKPRRHRSRSHRSRGRNSQQQQQQQQQQKSPFSQDGSFGQP